MVKYSTVQSSLIQCSALHWIQCRTVQYLGLEPQRQALHHVPQVRPLQGLPQRSVRVLREGVQVEAQGAWGTAQDNTVHDTVKYCTVINDSVQTGGFLLPGECSSAREGQETPST